MKTKFKLIHAVLVLTFMLLSCISYSQWTQTSLGWSETYNGAVSGSNIYIGTIGAGVYASADNGETWLQKGLQNISEISATGASGKYVFAGTSNPPGKIFRSTDIGDTWIEVFNANQSISIYAIAVNGRNVFAGTDQGMYRSTNHGDSWEFMPHSYGHSIVEIVINGSFVYEGQFNLPGLWMSSDNGETWQQTLNGHYVYSIAVKGEHIFAGTDFDGLFYSSDNGASWSQTSLNVPLIFSVAIRGNNIFISNFDFFTFSGSVYRSTNNGSDWSVWNDGFTSTFATIIYPILISGDQVLAVTHPHSVWKRPLHGNSNQFAPVVNNELIRQPDLSPSQNIIGKFSQIHSLIERRKNNGNNKNNESVISSQSSYKLNENYPNPFNPSTKISFVLPQANNVKLTVYDAIGKEVAVLVNEFRQSGQWSVDFNAANLPSGVYFYRLESGSFVETKKMLMIK